MPKPQRHEPCPLPRQRAEPTGRGSQFILPEQPYKNTPNLIADTGDRHPATRVPLPAPVPQVGSTSVKYVPPPAQTFTHALSDGLPQIGPTDYVSSKNKS
jgi:hypothetical protein